MPEKRF